MDILKYFGLYKAKIVGFLPSKKRPGYYYPVFEYADGDGVKRECTSDSYVEWNPFTARRNYRVREVVNRDGFFIYERSTKKMSFRKRFCLLLFFGVIASMVKLELGQLISLVLTVYLLGHHALNIRRIMKPKKDKKGLRAIKGKVVGYQKLCRSSKRKMPPYAYRPIIEYQYGGAKYEHISKMQPTDTKYPIDTICKVYVNKKRNMVFDEMEAETTFGQALLQSFIPNYLLWRSRFAPLCNLFKTQKKGKRYAPKRKISGTVSSVRGSSKTKRLQHNKRVRRQSGK